MRPHEETWVLSVAGKIRLHAPGTGHNGALVAEVATAHREAIILAAPEMARALKKALQVGRRRNSEVVEFRTPACWDGIYAYLKKEGHGHSDCEEMHASLAKAGVPLP